MSLILGNGPRCLYFYHRISGFNSEFLLTTRNFRMRGVTLKWLYSVVVITFGSDPNNPSSNPGMTYHFTFLHLLSACYPCGEVSTVK
ncbi:uncharacterized protein RJT20DRAFT_124619 [Scheffersomyces xylosifermentans]|uniref:uncharacterized protein n=1 Tax=Scheffersomyces xylosifermentans TaxID=1304137 RepID=UPI00315D48D3